jgi:hypothetical protein
VPDGFSFHAEGFWGRYVFETIEGRATVAGTRDHLDGLRLVFSEAW